MHSLTLKSKFKKNLLGCNLFDWLHLEIFHLIDFSIFFFFFIENGSKSNKKIQLEAFTHWQFANNKKMYVCI